MRKILYKKKIFRSNYSLLFDDILISIYLDDPIRNINLNIDYSEYASLTNLKFSIITKRYFTSSFYYELNSV